MDNRDTGAHGEAVAAEIIHHCGYHILKRNVRIGRGEIDIVAYKDGVYHFVEVKTRTGTGYGHAAQSLSGSKLRRMSRLGEAYMKREDIHSGLFSIDLMAIDIDGDGTIKSNWIKNITL